MTSARRRLLLRSLCFLFLALGCFSDNRVGWTDAIGYPFSIVGSEGLRVAPFSAQARTRRPFIGVLETDAWSHRVREEAFLPVAEFPINRSLSWRVLRSLNLRKPTTDLLYGTAFTPSIYLGKIAETRNHLAAQRDVLLYYGGIPQGHPLHGLNFNAWSVDELRQLRRLGCQPFVGIETADPAAIQWLIQRLARAGFGWDGPLYLRILAEPSDAAYGSEEGRPGSRHGTSKAVAAYRLRFAQAARQIQRLRAQSGMNLKIVFAGTNRRDFDQYLPARDLFDDIGFDLYLTPANEGQILPLLQEVLERYPDTPFVIPEFGIATAGPKGSNDRGVVEANPTWAANCLAEVLEMLGRRRLGVRQITVFSVNAGARLENRRWDWGWTPTMFEMLREWHGSPRRWMKHGFHPYDPRSYPVGRDVLYIDQPSIRIVCRRLASTGESPRFLTITYLRQGDDTWAHTLRITSRPLGI